MSEFGFLKQEVNHIIKNKPTVVFYKQEEGGIRGVHNYLCVELGFSIDTFKTLVVKNPSIISKDK